jgi:hypothetical protein
MSAAEPETKGKTRRVIAQPPVPGVTPLRPARQPVGALADLGLSAEELDVLKHQGFVTAEFRGRFGPYFRLHFRIAGRQTTRYVGRDPDVAHRIRRELEELQRVERHRRRLDQLAEVARRSLRAAKARLEPLMRAAGWHYHGLAIRRARPPAAPADEDHRAAPSPFPSTQQPSKE